MTPAQTVMISKGLRAVSSQANGVFSGSVAVASEPRAEGQPPFSVDEGVALEFVHRLRFARGVLEPGNPLLRDALALDEESPRRVVVFIDSGLAAARPSIHGEVVAYAAAHEGAFELTGPPHVVVGGERGKNDAAVLGEILRVIHEARICRRSYVVAIGGGAMLDVVGYAATTAHRGVRLVRLPTTTLAQADSGIGVKNGVNLFGKKNYLGAFAVPWAVINDYALLETLSDRDWRCGLSEAVKVGLVKDVGLYDLLIERAEALRRRDEPAAEAIWQWSAELHLRHIARGGDPFELTAARPLDFGHWAAHKLEQMTGYELRHGEAVAIGMAIDLLYSSRIRLLPAADAEAAVGLLERLGFDLRCHAMADVDELLQGLEEFREHLGGQLTITMVRQPGAGVDLHEIDESIMRSVIRDLLARAD